MCVSDPVLRHQTNSAGLGAQQQQHLISGYVSVCACEEFRVNPVRFSIFSQRKWKDFTEAVRREKCQAALKQVGKVVGYQMFSGSIIPHYIWNVFVFQSQKTLSERFIFVFIFLDFSDTSQRIWHPSKKIHAYQMTFTKTAGAMATPVQVWEGASEPEIKFWDAIMSSPWCKIISKSPVISVASSA